jgi:alkaline phosphatase
MNQTKKYISSNLFYAVILFISVNAIAFNYETAKGNTKDLGFYEPPQKNLTLIQPSGKAVQNIILCIGDGMGLNQIAMARQKIGGLDGRLWMETLPIAGLVRTFSADSAITDSAAASTAMACGIKTNNGVLGIGTDGKAYASILELLAGRGFRTGLVVTSTISHATPAGFASHVSSRGSENEIAEQMLNHRIDILFGGGRQYWLPAGVAEGKRSDTQNLLNLARQRGYRIIENKAEMDKLTYGPVIGLFNDDGLTTFEPEPMLAEMAAKAISLLNTKNSDWFAPEPKFFLMIEGSQIDWAGHNNDTHNSIRQTLLFDMAVKAAIDFARQDRRTLLIVTADHETGGLLLQKDNSDPEKIHLKWHTTDHTGVDVPLFAFGPGAVEFAGVQDNTEIPRKIAELLSIDTFPQLLTGDEIESSRGKSR